MAATQSYGVMAPFNHANQCVDPSDMDSWVDFNAIPSPTPMKHQPATPSTISSPTNGLLSLEDEPQNFSGPSHEYDRFKQQTGLPTGSMSTFNNLQSQAYSQMSNTLESIEDFGFNYGSQSGLSSMDVDSSPSTMPAYFYSGNGPNNDDFVNPSAIESHDERTPQTMRVWPGMHQQQALAKAQAQAQQQRQQQMMQQQQQKPQQAAQQHGHKRNVSSQTDARTEDMIQRVVNQIRQNSQGEAGRSMSPPGLLPQVIRMKKDEEDMDEDERLLASEEGKKLSSKERRQLRNKVSARAFRSRRKEYIGQLEGEVAIKTNEVNELKLENHSLMEENARSRAFIEKLLRHPAFHPFLDDLSRDPALSDSLQKMTAPQQSAQQGPSQPTQHQQQFMEGQRQENLHVGMVQMPEPQIDMAGLSINNNSNWQVPSMGFQYQPQVFAVLEVPEGPENPFDSEELSGKTYEPTLPSVEEEKVEYPIIETPAPVEIEETPAPVSAAPTDDDPCMTLYADAPTAPATESADSSEDFEPLFGEIAPEKVFSHIELFVSSEEDNEALAQRFAKLTARADRAFQRLQMLDEE